MKAHYRPRQARGAPYITPEGERRLQEELRYLWKVKRPEVTRAVSEAAALGDRSENAEYIYGKKQLREIDRRVRYLSRRLDELQVVDRLPEDTSRVFFGAWVTLEDPEGKRHRYRIVGPDEFDTSAGLISVDSPLARALLGKRVAEEVEVRAPEGARVWELVHIEYPALHHEAEA